MDFFVWVIIYYSFINLLAMLFYFVDKRKAIAGADRVPEKTLIFLAAIGGGAGAFAAMHIFHHKTKKKKFQIWVPVWLLIHILLIGFVTYQNNHLVVSEYTYETEGVNCRIVQVSDLHNVYLWFNKDLVVNKVKEQNPDIIVITGDIVDSNHTNIDKAVYQAKQFTTIADTYYVTGNHEYFLSKEERDELLTKLEQSGVHILQDEYVVIEGYGNQYALIGLDDKSLLGDTAKELSDNVKKEQGELLQVALAHEPQYIGDYAKTDIDLVLSGHAHGGQMVLPGIGALVAPDQGFRPKYVKGEYFIENMNMIVSVGIGNSVIPVRLFDYPEVVVVNMVEK